MAEQDSTTKEKEFWRRISDAEGILKRIHALGAILANQSWEIGVSGEDLQYCGFLIEDLTSQAQKILFPEKGSEAPQAAPEGGAA